MDEMRVSDFAHSHGVARKVDRPGGTGAALADGAQGVFLYCRRGPATEQDRWEEVGGYSPYTIAVEIAALLEAAEFSLGARAG